MSANDASDAGTLSVRWNGPSEVDPQTDASTRIARVLIVDDHEINRRICAACCDLFHFACDAVRSGAEALEALRREHFDVVLMDIHMPGMNGMEAMRAIRALPGRAGRVPVIAVTFDAGPVESAAYLAAGMVDVAPKPITPARLFKAISRALEPDADESRSWAAAEA
jgi:CheY-like chemotaxis protein